MVTNAASDNVKDVLWRHPMTPAIYEYISQVESTLKDLRIHVGSSHTVNGLILGVFQRNCTNLSHKCHT